MISSLVKSCKEIEKPNVIPDMIIRSYDEVKYNIKIKDKYM